MFKYKAVLLISFLILIGIFFRCYDLDRWSLWYDECLSLIQSRFLYNIIFGQVLEINPPLFYIGLHFWQNISKNENWLHFYPALCSILTIIVYLVFVLKNYSKNLLIWLIFYLSLSPLHIYYSRELKPYSISTLMISLTIFYYVKFLKTKAKKGFLPFILFSILSLYSIYFTIFPILILGFHFLITKKFHQIPLWYLLIYYFFVFFIFNFWLMHIFDYQLSDAKTFSNAAFPKTSYFLLIILFRDLIIGFQVSHLVSFIALIIFSGILLIKGIIIEWKHFKSHLKGLNSCLILLIIFFIIISWKSIGPVFSTRYYLFLLPNFLLLISIGSNSLKNKLIRASIIIIYLVLFISAINNFYKNIIPYKENPFHRMVHYKKDFKGFSRYLVKNYKDKEGIAHSDRNTMLPLFYYSNYKLMGKYVLFNPEIGALPEKLWVTVFRYNLKSIGIKDYIKDYEKLWLVYSAWEPYYLQGGRAILNWLMRKYKLEKIRYFQGITLYYFNLKEKKND